MKKYINKDRLGKLFLMIWIPVISIIISFQMVSHIISMPLPEDYQKINNNLPLLRQTDRWLMVHVIYQNCSCTNALTKSLLERGSKNEAEEWILYADGNEEIQKKFEGRGYSFHAESKASIDERYGIEAAPLLLIFSPDNQLKYGGGYFERPSVFRSTDQLILSRLKNGEVVEALPVYGCAVSTRLQKIVDPFGVKF